MDEIILVLLVFASPLLFVVLILWLERENKLESKKNFNKLIESLLTNQNIKLLILNFFNHFPDKIFLNKDQFIPMERSIINKYGDNGAFSLVSPCEQRNDLRYGGGIICYGNDIMEPFEMLTKLLRKQFKFETDSDCIYATWRLLTIYAIEYYSDEWTKEYGQYFTDQDCLSIDDYVKVYCSIDYLDSENDRNIGLFTYSLMNMKKFEKDNTNFIECNDSLVPILFKEIESKKLSNFENKLSSYKEKLAFTIDDVDLMNGSEFENFIAILFTKMGYSTKATKASGDQGIDIIAEKNGKRLGIQAKCYSNTVPNSAIQEVTAGIAFYNCDKGIVITNNFFSKSAIKLAESNNMILWDRNKLKEKMFEMSCRKLKT